MTINSMLRVSGRFAVTAMLCVSAGWCAGAAPLRIMPLGDSITMGYGVGGGYRTQLYSNLVNAGYSFQFVGLNNENTSPALVEADQVLHNGHDGFKIHQITESITGVNDWLGSNPDIILLQAGETDFSRNEDTIGAIDRLDTLIATITSRRPEAILIVANLVLRTDDPLYEGRVQTQFNPFVPGLVSSHAALGEKVHFVDMHSALGAEDIIDGLHPNKAGYNKLGDAWFQAIQTALGPDAKYPPLVGSSTLTVVSVNPPDGVSIGVSPNDNNGQGQGLSFFTRSYTNNSEVTLSAPLRVSGKVFAKWQQDGIDLSTNPVVTVIMNTNHTLTVSFTKPLVVGIPPLVSLSFNEKFGSTVLNAGTAGGTFALTPDAPLWSANAPADTGGGSALDFGYTQGDFAVDSAEVIPALRGLSGFTITAWINSRSPVQGPGGNRLVTWMNDSGDGVDLAYLGDGSIDLGVNRAPDGSARSSAGQIPEGLEAPLANWRFVAVTYDSTAGTASFYFGSDEADATLDVERDYAQGPAGTEIGRLTIGHSNPATRAFYIKRVFRGLIDNVQIFDRRLQPSEIVCVQRTGATGVSPAISPLLEAKPRIVSITRLEDGRVRLLVAGSPGYRFSVLAGTDLSHWTVLTDATADATGAFEFTDSEATGFPMRFYSVVGP